jgi:hypothetical protein
LTNGNKDKNKTAVSAVTTKTATRVTETNTVGHCEEQCKGIALLDKYTKSVCAMNKRTAHEYYLRLTNFRHFIICSYKTALDNIIIKINKGSEDPYDILSGYVTYLQTTYNISASTLKERVVTACKFA